MNTAEAEDNKWTPVVHQGGLATNPSEPNGGNWLGMLDKGTIFLYRRRVSNPNYELEVFQVIHQWGDAALLGRHHEDQPDFIKYVDTKLFSSQHEWFKTIFVLPKEQEQITGEQHDGDRSD